MNRFLLIIAFGLSCASTLQAQIAHWRIHPHFNSLRMADSGDAIVSDSAGVSSIWNISGQRITTTSDHIMPLFDGIAASVSPDLRMITGIYHPDGSFISLQGKGYGVAFGYPYFVGKYLTIREGNEGCNLIDQKGRLIFKTPYYRMYPFSKGLVSCMSYMKPSKRMGPYCLYYDEKLQEVPIKLNGKTVPIDHIQFLSTVADDGRAVALINNYFFWFEAESRALSELKTPRGEHVHLDKAFEKAVTNGPWGEPQTMTAIGAKNEVVTFKFNQQGYPVTIEFTDHTITFPRAPRVLEARLTNLSRIIDEKTGLIGICLDQDTILPPQFTEVPVMFGDDAIVCLGDKYGQIHIDRDASFELQLNRNEDMAFLHRNLDVPLRIDMPSYISPADSRIITSPTVGFEVDLSSIKSRRTKNGSFAEFDCTLKFPQGLSSDSLAQIIYPLQYSYEGLLSSTLHVSANAWHYKYFDVNVPTSEIEIKDGNVKFNFYIKRTSHEKNYPFEVQIDAKGLPYTLDKISENYYQCFIKNLKEGDNSIIVNVTEQGCPPVSCPVDVTYKKPNKAQGTTHAKKSENVVIKVKKNAEVEKKKPTKVIIPI